MEKQKQQPQWLQSLDAFRSFGIFFTMDGVSLFVALATLPPNPFFQTITGWTGHVEWNGLAHYNTISPLFPFIAGISFPSSLEKQRGKGMTEEAAYKKIVYRGITLVFLGLVYSGLLSLEFDHLRCANVLARIGLGWMFTALLFVRFGWKARAGITVLTSVSYWLVVAFVSMPDAGGTGLFTLEGNLVGHIDRLFLPGRLYETVFDPKGLFSTIPVIATAMSGMFTGEWIKLRKEELTDRSRVLCLVGMGVVLLIVDLLWSLVSLINRKLWTGSFVCVVGTYSVWIFTLFFYIIGILGWRRWASFFTVIGTNSITIYLVQRFIRFSYTSEAILGGSAKLMPKTAQPLVSAIAYIAVRWGFLYFLYRQRIFLRI